jgi:hypothetical protein
LKSPISPTRRAFGAHTLKTVPLAGIGAQLVVQPAVRTLPKQVDIVLGQRGRAPRADPFRSLRHWRNLDEAWA